MSITELGALGEFVGSIAVLATLVYLAFQTRQNGLMLSQSKDAQTATMIQANMNLWHNLYGRILESAETARIFRAVKSGREVANEDRERVDALLTMWMLNLENLLFQSRLNPFLDNVDEILEPIFDQNVAMFMSSAHAREWWRSSSRVFGPNVVAAIDAALLRQRAD